MALFKAVGLAAGLLALNLSSGSVAAEASNPAATKVQLVTDKTIQTQRQLTSKHQLKNGIPVIVREIPDSDILQVNVTFGTGLKDLPPGRKALNEWLWAVMPMAAKGYAKAEVYSLAEKYGLEIACAGGIEYSTCALGTLNDYWKTALPLFSAIVAHPALTPEDIKLTKDRLTASLGDVPSDPGTYVNEIVNKIFYPAGHPYRLNHDEALADLAHLGRSDLLAYHDQALNPQLMTIVVATSLPSAKVVADLEKAFGHVKPQIPRTVKPLAPVFNEATAYSFEDRTLPTAYLRIKMNAPSIFDEDAVATRLLYEILSEELGDEIRTKRSLSYAVHSYVIQYTLGIGVLSASTSKPQETLAAIGDVLDHVRQKTFTDQELDEYKHGFATNYYLAQETHASLAAALSNAWFFYGDPNQYYEMPRLLDKVTPADIQRLANEWLNDLRIGVIYGRKDFQDSWALDLIKKNLKHPAPKEAAPAPVVEDDFKDD